MHPSRLPYFLIIALLMAAATPRAASAAEKPVGGTQSESEKRGTWTLLVENDVFSGTDRHYTNGLHLSWFSGAGDVPDSAVEAASWVPFLLAPDGKRRIGFSFGHSIFTPADIKIAEKQPDDRPYAAWLYGGIALLSETPRTLEILELDVGVVGPAALGEEVQKNWHDLIGSPMPQGWDHQIKNEPAVALIYERKWREDVWQLGDTDLGMDVTPLIGAALGNVFTYASTGLAIRLGDDLLSDFGPPRVRPSLPGSGFFDLSDRFGWYVFASAEGRAVARNIFLDGNTFVDSDSVDKLPFVADFQVGVAITINAARITVAQIYRTREFKTQNEPDRFSAISLSLKF